MRRVCLGVLVLLMSISAFAQQDYVGRFSAFGGYSFLNSPKLNLFENGFDGTFGVNIKRWIAFGFDFSIFTGGSSLVPSDLNASAQQQLAPVLVLLPPGATISVPFDAKTSTYAIGPQINIRKLKKVTFLVRPALGALHEDVTGETDESATGSDCRRATRTHRENQQHSNILRIWRRSGLFPQETRGASRYGRLRALCDLPEFFERRT